MFHFLENRECVHFICNFGFQINNFQYTLPVNIFLRVDYPRLLNQSAVFILFKSTFCSICIVPKTSLARSEAKNWKVNFSIFFFFPLLLSSIFFCPSKKLILIKGPSCLINKQVITEFHPNSFIRTTLLCNLGWFVRFVFLLHLQTINNLWWNLKLFIKPSSLQNRETRTRHNIEAYSQTHPPFWGKKFLSSSIMIWLSGVLDLIAMYGCKA